MTEQPRLPHAYSLALSLSLADICVMTGYVYMTASQKRGAIYEKHFDISRRDPAGEVAQALALTVEDRTDRRDQSGMARVVSRIGVVTIVKFDAGDLVALSRHGSWGLRDGLRPASPQDDESEN